MQICVENTVKVVAQQSSTQPTMTKIEHVWPCFEKFIPPTEKKVFTNETGKIEHLNQFLPISPCRKKKGFENKEKFGPALDQTS